MRNNRIFHKESNVTSYKKCSCTHAKNYNKLSYLEYVSRLVSFGEVTLINLVTTWWYTRGINMADDLHLGQKKTEHILIMQILMHTKLIFVHLYLIYSWNTHALYITQLDWGKWHIWFRQPICQPICHVDTALLFCYNKKTIGELPVSCIHCILFLDTHISFMSYKHFIHILNTHII